MVLKALIVDPNRLQLELIAVENFRAGGLGAMKLSFLEIPLISFFLCVLPVVSQHRFKILILKILFLDMRLERRFFRFALSEDVSHLLFFLAELFEFVLDEVFLFGFTFFHV